MTKLPRCLHKLHGNTRAMIAQVGT